MNRKIFWAVLGCVLAVMGCSLPFTQVKDAPDAPVVLLMEPNAESFEVSIADASLLEPVDLSGAQRQVLAVYGLPNRFMITFTSQMREETWYYDTDGHNITFRNGEIYTESQGEPVLGDMLLTSDYNPWMFSSEIGLSELLAITGSESFAIERLDEVFEEEVSLVTLKGLDAGFRGETLLFVRAIPIRVSQFIADGEGQEVQDGQPATELPAGVNLTAAEQAHAGTRTYQTYCTYSDGTSEDYVGPVTWEFKEDGIYFDGEGPFPWVSENLYGLADSDGEFFIHLQENVITITGEAYDLDAQGEAILVTFACAMTQE